MYFANKATPAQAVLLARICGLTTRLKKAVFWVAALALFSTVCVPLHAWHHRRKQTIKASVRFVAASTLLRSTVGWNKDSYLAEVNFRENTEQLLVRLIDAYPPFAPPLSRRALTAPSGTALRIRRDPVCDIRYGEMLLRAAPGDLLAVTPFRLSYRPPLHPPPASGAILPCYRTVRN